MSQELNSIYSFTNGCDDSIHWNIQNCYENNKWKMVSHWIGMQPYFAFCLGYIFSLLMNIL